MNSKFSALPVLASTAIALLLGYTSHAALPARYALERQVFQLQVTDGYKIDTDVLLNAAGQILFSTSQGQQNSNQQFLFQSPDGSVESLPVPAGFEVLLPASMNATGDIVGKTYRSLYQPNYAEAGFVRFPGEDPEIATNLDTTQSYIAFVSDLGTTAGASRFPVNHFRPFVSTLLSVEPLDGPPDYGYFEVRGLSTQNEVLLFAADDDAPTPPQRRLAIATPGQATTFLNFGTGDAASATSAMNTRGDVATLVKNTSGGVDVRFVSADNRMEYRSVTSTGAYNVLYSFAMNVEGQVVFAKQTNGQPDRVIFADVAKNIIREFEGYRPMLNDNGEVLFGKGGAIMYWDSATPGTQPAPVPANIPTNPQGNPELLAFNNAGRVALSYFSPDGSSQLLGIFHPVAPTPPAPRPKPVPVPPAPTPEPTPSPVEIRIEFVQQQIQVARRIRNPTARQARLRRLNIELRRLNLLNALEQN